MITLLLFLAFLVFLRHQAVMYAIDKALSLTQYKWYVKEVRRVGTKTILVLVSHEAKIGKRENLEVHFPAYHWSTDVLVSLEIWDVVKFRFTTSMTDYFPNGMIGTYLVVLKGTE